VSGSPNRSDSTSKKDTLSPESEGTRSTARPPAEAALEGHGELDLAAAVRAAKAPPSARNVAPAATAKIRPFQLAEALARLSADGDPSSIPPPLGGDPAANGQMSVPTPAIDIKSEDLAELGSRRPPLTASSTPPATAGASGAVRRISDVPPSRPPVISEEAAGGGAEAKTEVSDENAADEKKADSSEEASADATTDAPKDEPSEADADESRAADDEDHDEDEADPPVKAAPAKVEASRSMSPLTLFFIVMGVAMLVYAYITSNR
jgi:hypothetical protein